MTKLNDNYYEEREEIKVDPEIKDDFDMWVFEQEMSEEV